METALDTLIKLVAVGTIMAIELSATEDWGNTEVDSQSI